MKNKNILVFCMVALIATSSSLCFAADPFLAADITVTDSIVSAGIEPIGANLTTITGGTNLAVNNHIRNSGFEPFVLRKFVRVNRAGTNWFEWDQEGGPGYWNLAWTGLLNGATVRFYRIVDASGSPMSYGDGTDMTQIGGADHVVFLGETTIPMPGTEYPEGGYIANDDRDGSVDNDMARVYVTGSDLGLRFGDYAYISLKATTMGEETSPPDLRQHFRGVNGFFTTMSGTSEAELVAHPGTLPESFTDHGETCLKLTFANPETVRLGQYTYHPYDDGEGQWYSQLHPGASYRVSIWMRQENLGNNGQARFRFNGPYDVVSQQDYWQVTGQWQQFTYDFIAPAYPTTGSHIAHQLEFTGPGTVWIDNFILYRNDAEHEYRPFTPHTVSFNGMLDSVAENGKKPAMRFYGPIFQPSSIEAMFTNYGNSSYNVAWNAGVGNAPDVTIAQALYWAYKSGDSPETRFVPFLTCNEEYTEEEWMALVEFLGVPYDPEVDSPESKPYAFLRYKYRNNNPTPWTDEFKEIIVEYGNESWHNGAGGYGWHGWGPPGYVHYGGVEYGLFAHYMFDEHVMQSPFWSQYNLGDKIKFSLGGNYAATTSSYVEAAIQQNATIAYAGHANYVGPKWETNDSGTSVFDDHGIQMTLLGMHSSMKTLIENAATIRDQLNQNPGINYQLVAYEGGPSGYWTNPDNEEIDELYGKSVAMGVAALDAWLYSSQHGFTHQAYLGFASGKWWSSHTVPEAGGFRPHPGWMALTMRNRYVAGEDMTSTTVNTTPTIESDGEDIPLISSYTIKGPGSYAVFILSRKLDGVHDGVDFGDGYTPVTLHLPFSEVNSITRYRLEDPNGLPADPRSNNRSAENIQLGVLQLDPSAFSSDFTIDADRGGEAGGLAPGSINLFVFDLPGGTLSDAIALLQVLSGSNRDLTVSSIPGHDGDGRLGLAEVIDTLQSLSAN